MSELLYVEDASSAKMHASRTAEVGGPRDDTLVFEDARHCQTVCGEEIAADNVGTWSREEPYGKIAKMCPDCSEGISEDSRSEFDPSDIDLDEPPEMPDPPMYEEWEGVETWSKANLRYPVPGGWDIEDHGKFHTTWKHEDGATLTRSSKRTPGPKDTFAFKLNGEEIHRVDTGPERVEMREETVWLLTFYNENEGVDSPASFQQQIREERNASLGDFA